MISDYFPPEKRTFANSIYTLGIYIGNSVSSLTTLVIDKVGWRYSFKLIGVCGILIGLLSLLIIKEPKRNAFDKVIKVKPKMTGMKLIKAYQRGYSEIFRN